jgi:hypothetical protein
MILCGDPSRFAVKWEVVHPSDTPWGRFALVIDGKTVGDFDDDGTYLIGCYNHVADVIHDPEDRFEPGLFEMDKAQAFKVLAHSVLAFWRDIEPFPEIYRNTHGRFLFHDIGMTSMDRFVLLFIQSEQGESRFIWRELEGEIHEARVPAGEVEAVIADFLEKAEPDMAPTNKANSSAWKAANARARDKARAKQDRVMRE